MCPEDDLTAFQKKCQIKESQNAMGKGRCSSSADCYGHRTCSLYNWCEGHSMCPVSGAKRTAEAKAKAISAAKLKAEKAKELLDKERAAAFLKAMDAIHA